MPAKDRYHDNVVHALQKDGWRIEADPYTLNLPTLRLYVDLQAQRNNEDIALIEIKVFENVDSPVTYLSSAVGQYLLYQAALELLRNDTPLYLAVPVPIYDTLLSEELLTHYLVRNNVKIVTYDPLSEEIKQWIP